MVSLIWSRIGAAHCLKSKIRIPRALKNMVTAFGWQMSGRVPWMITRSGQESTPMILSE